MLRSIGTTELVIVFVILLVLFGGKKLPELGRGVGDAIREFKKSLKSKD
jgi:sec-independent protein translocase protein TatA